MKQELIGPTASVTAALLARYNGNELSTDVIASAFEDAYRGVQAGIQRIEAEEARLKTAAATRRR